MELIKKYHRKLNPAILLLLFFLFIGGMVMMRYFANKIAAYQDFQKILDLRMGYSFEECQSYLSGLGEDGRSLYKNCFFYVDLIYMFLYNTFYFSVLLFLLEKTGFKKCKPVLFLPLLGFIFDLGENLLIRQMINNFNTMSQALCYISSIFTVLKFVCAYGSLGFCCLMAIYKLHHDFRC